MPLMISVPRAPSRRAPRGAGRRAGGEHRHRAHDPRARARRRRAAASGDCRVMDGRSLGAAAARATGRLACTIAPWLSSTQAEHHGFSSCSYRGLRVGDETYVEHTIDSRLRPPGLCEPGSRSSTTTLGATRSSSRTCSRSAGERRQRRGRRSSSERLAALRICAGHRRPRRRAKRSHPTANEGSTFSTPATGPRAGLARRAALRGSGPVRRTAAALSQRAEDARSQSAPRRSRTSS